MILAWIATILKNNAFYIILMAGLAYQSYNLNEMTNHYDSLNITYDQVVNENKDLKGDNTILKDEIDRLKSEADKDIVLSKIIQTPINKSKIRQDDIDNIEPIRGYDDEDEGDVVDIDGKLPDDLIRLLQ